MMAMQISANGSSGNARRFHSTPAMPETTAALRMRLRAPATGNRIECEEGGQGAYECHRETKNAASVKHRLAGLLGRHGPYVCPASEARNG